MIVEQKYTNCFNFFLCKEKNVFALTKQKNLNQFFSKLINDLTQNQL